MNRTYRKNIFRTIKQSLGRYLAIFAIITLGVGFFTGLKASKPSMLKTGQEYVKAQKLFDYQLISTWGFEPEEVEKIRKISPDLVAEGALWEDFLRREEDGTETVMKALSITENINQILLTEGELPQKANECVLDASVYPVSMIGKEITLSPENTKETLDCFQYTSYKVTGLVRSPLYLHGDRGTTTLGNGKITGFVYLPLEGFSYEYFEEVYLSYKESKDAFTEAYHTKIEENTKFYETQVLSLVEERYQQEMQDAQKEIADGEKEIADAEADLLEGQQELAEGEAKLAEETAKAEKELASAKQELTKGEAELAQGKQELLEAEITLQEKEQELLAGESALVAGETQYQTGYAQYQENLAKYQQGEKEYRQGLQQLKKSKKEYQKAVAAKEQMEAAMPIEVLQQEESYLAVQKGIQEYEKNQKLLEETKNTLQNSKEKLEEAKRQLEESNRQLVQNRNTIEEGKIQIAQGKQELSQAKEELHQAEEKIEKGWQEYWQGVETLEEEVAQAKADLSQGRKDLEEGKQDLEEGKQELLEAKAELEKVEAPEVYVLDRNTNVGYANFDNDISIVESVSKVFPIFFFLIAALVCSTTMTRMVDDERTQIGTLRALGYSEGAILMKYLFYSGSAAFLAVLTGYLAGTRVFPTAIWFAYGMMYGFAELIIVDQKGLLILSLLVSFFCSVGTTYAACRVELLHAPAELIRPKAPSAGKRILLERIPVLWKNLKFLHKVSARNVFRFKKRMIMMILGISGCMALVMAGFGIKDSVGDISRLQYENIFQYHISATFSQEVTEKEKTEIQNQIGEKIKNDTLLMEASGEISQKDVRKNATILISEGETIGECIDFHYKNQPVSLPGKGEILIDQRLAEVFDLEKGQEISVKIGDAMSQPLTISGIFENYTFYYAYLTAETYEAVFGEEYLPKTMYFSLAEEVDHHEIGTWLSNLENVSYISVIADTIERVEKTMDSMNYVVLLVIACAAALAFIVLFNLGNINISERVREIATLKVLGFYPRETGAYVFRESLVLSLLGIFVGIPLGILLHRFVMAQVQVEMMGFKTMIKPQSYGYSILAVLGFTLCVDVIMRRKISRIPMAESLKSIE